MRLDKRVYLHIGQDKAGSSAIQSFLLRNYERLNLADYDLAGGRCQHHGKLFASVVNGDFEKLRADCDYIRTSPCKHFIISFEGIYSLNEDKLQQFLGYLKEFMLIVVFYVRRRSDKLRSGFAQNLKLGNPKETRHARFLVNDEIELMCPEKQYSLNYLAIVRTWQTCLRNIDVANDFRLRVYERSSFIEGDLLTDFCRTIDLLTDGESLDSKSLERPSKISNPSLSPAAQYLTVFAKLVHPNEDQLRDLQKLMVACESEGADRLSLIPDAVVNALDLNYRSDDEVLAREFFARSSLFVEPSRFSYAKPDGESFASLIRAMAKKAKLFED